MPLTDLQQADGAAIETLFDLVRMRASRQPNQTAYTFLKEGSDELATLTYGELDLRARAIAALLQSAEAAGERVLLLYPPGLEYVCGFVGCLYAGAVAVPVPPPRFNRKMDRLVAIARDSQPRVVLTTQATVSRADLLWESAAGARPPIWLATDQIVSQPTSDWRPPSINKDSLAFLQYTSGSTASPRGVRVTHGNLLHNEGLIQEAFNQNEQSVILSWLPLYHDMGLIGGLLQPIYLGATCILMSPLTFLQRPLRWLQEISRFKVTTSGGPNFAYDLCARLAEQQDCSTLDLSSWRVAFNGSEPILEETLRRFATAFEPCGFKKESFYPCYGLAEATLLVTGGRLNRHPWVMQVRADALKSNRIVDSDSDDQNARSLVSSGRVRGGQQVVIVNDETSRLCPPDRIGEIWVRGPSVAAGYHGHSEKICLTFQAYLAETGEGPFLRTGDLGFIRSEELFVTGRLKDLIIIRGENHYPQDIELTAQRSSSGLRFGSGAAFSIEVDAQERLVIVQEVEPRQPINLDQTIELIRQSVAEAHQLPAYTIVLVKKGTIPKTSSGKIRRSACRQAYLERKLTVLAEWVETAAPQIGDSHPIEVAAHNQVEASEHWLTSLLASRVGLEASQIDINQPIHRYGLDSLGIIELIHAVERMIGITLPMSLLFQAPSIHELAEVIAGLSAGLSGAPPPANRSSKARTEFEISRGQQALYFLHQLVPDDPIHNIAVVGVAQGRLVAETLRSSFQALCDRHAELRANFRSDSSGFAQRIDEAGKVWFREADATDWSTTDLNAQLDAEAGHRFDLEREPLLRVTLYKRETSSILLCVIHHLVADFWSLELLVKELQALYTAGGKAQLSLAACDYSAYVEWQEDMLASAEGDHLWAYWKAKLGGPLPVLDLPIDRQRPPIQTYACGRERFRLSAATVERLDQLGELCGATPFMRLAAAFQVFLHRYTGQKEILLGALTSGRNQARFAEVVGYFVNPIVLRVEHRDDWTFYDCLTNMRETAVEAFAHQDYPFPLLVEKLQLEHDARRPPLVQAMLFYQKAHLADHEDLTPLAVGEAGSHMALGDIRLELRPAGQPTTQFDLTLKVARIGGGVRGTLEYNAALFDADTIARLADHFQHLIEVAVLMPSTPIAELPLMRPAEREQVLRGWNETSLPAAEARYAHQLFEDQAARTPAAVAITFAGQQVTYETLDARANQVAWRLRGMGVGPEVRVGICLSRSVELAVSLLGTLKAGGAYVPLDPAFPQERLSLMAQDSQVRVIITESSTVNTVAAKIPNAACLDIRDDSIERESKTAVPQSLSAENLAYVIYTSGSTGKPKGVMVNHANLCNFIRAMDRQLNHRPPGVWLAVTSISFDISVLELIWTLTRGFRLVIQAEQDLAHQRLLSEPPATDKEMQFSLFYFASDDREAANDRYRLLMEGAKFADRHGFCAVWTPERHFHPFGGLYPNPSVTGAAVAAITQNVQVRAGSVVLPLHNPIRVAEEWSVIDNLSKGRAGISIASGWHADDFVLMPNNYADRKERMAGDVAVIRKLWRGEPVSFTGGAGNEVEIRIYPRPVQSELPLWVTAAGSPETFRLAGALGTNLLTHLLGQTLEELAQKISIYRKAWQENGHGPGPGHVTLMVHTYIADDIEEVRATVKEPFCAYLKSSYTLIQNLARSLGENIAGDGFTPEDMDALLAHAFDRYFETSGLMGTPHACLATVERMKAIGVDEVACLIDFGVAVQEVLFSLERLDELKSRANQRSERLGEGHSVPAEVIRHGVTHLQCTPSMARLMTYDAQFAGAMNTLRVLLLGGEELPFALAQSLGEVMGAGEIRNLYGPTETTVWSTTDEVQMPCEKITIGRPIGNTQVYILDRKFEPAPPGLTGAFHIGGAGVVRGYANRPDLTAERFLPDPFSGRAGARLYATGDVCRYLKDGRIEYLGREDQQVKLRGFRIEPEEIELALERHRDVLQAAVVMQRDSSGDSHLAAYVVQQSGAAFDMAQMREFLGRQLPAYMIPSSLMKLDEMPLTPNGKRDRKALPLIERRELGAQVICEAPRTPAEEVIATAWAEVLGSEAVGIHDNFFEVGGNSILASRLISRLRELFKVDLPLRAFFATPSVSGLAELLTADAQHGAKVRRIAELLIVLADHSDEEAETILSEGRLSADVR